MFFLWLRWVLANAVGEVIGLGVTIMVILGVSSAAGNARGPLFTLAFVALAIGLGMYEGVMVGLAQWWAMHPWVPEISRRTWVGATVVGAFVAWCLGMIPSTVMSMATDASGTPAPDITGPFMYALAAGMGAVLGLLLGLPQWFVLRTQVARAGWWIIVTALGWLLGMPIVFIGAEASSADTTGVGMILLVLATLVAAGGVVGAVQGAFLARLLTARVSDRGSQPPDRCEPPARIPKVTSSVPLTKR